ncbi:putative Pectin lyase-like superfamily protein [Quillaja saponaria]|uniref:Pectin lyase-like superfamily protein n=1 Tax=Quillaja saponaria TaxID=32244 RepID=A0AAD7PDT0_QUISA|nr:putative Pectin lyase-like superfamily protein [Quillaja saponaria]
MGFKHEFVRVCLVMFLLVWVIEAIEAEDNIRFFNVKDYGAVADSRNDNTQAFLKAWNEACKWEGRARVWIPKGTYMLNTVTFQGPCKGSMAFVIKNGVLKAPADKKSFLSTETWINFQYVDQLTVAGDGTLDGQGAAAWPYNDCSKNPDCHSLPATMGFGFVTNSQVHHVRSINSKNTHFVLYGCDNMNFTKIRISAPGDSPNTDGIKIGRSTRIKISNSVIGTGDDCVALLSGLKKIDISQVVCGPGHGISIGSLGKYDDEDEVEEISVKNCTFEGTSDGVRIKTWASGFDGKVSNLKYEDIVMNNVGKPIIIDQEYCPHPPCSQTPSKIQISDVTYKNFRGSSSSDVAVTLNCSPSKPCSDIRMENIDLWHQNSGSGKRVTSSCSNAYGVSYGKQSPPSCF